MKITAEDPVLTAYALGELDEPTRASVKAAMAQDQSLAREGEAITSLGGLLTQTFQGEGFSLGEERRAEILKAGRRPDADVLVLDHRKRSRRQSFMVVAGVAAVVVAGFMGLSQLGTEGPGGANTTDAAGGGSVGPTDSNLAGGVMVPTGDSVQLPLNVKAADPTFVEISLAETGKIPPADKFQVEGWTNAARVVSAPSVTVSNVGVYAELGPCAWDEKSTLLLVNLRTLDGKEASLKATLNFNPERVKSSRLLGAAGFDGSTTPQSGVIKGDQTFLYQVELLPGLEQVGSLNLEIEDEVPGYLPLSASPKEEGSIDFSTVSLLTEFARWGASESRETEILEGLAKRAESLLGKVTDEKTRYALDMILLSKESLGK
jgi:hypothetical protein